MISLFFEGIVLGLLVAISLGPAFFAIIQTGINKGFKYGIYMALGVLFSDILLVYISYQIGATIFDDPENKVYVGLIGGIILIIFGSVSWAKKPEILTKRRYSPEKVIKESKPISYSFRGFFLNVANPFLFFFWFGALGFVGKNAIPGEILESTIVFFSGTFITIFLTDILKSFVGGKIKGFLKPRKEILLNKIVGILLVTFGVVLIFRTLSDFGFFEQLRSNLNWGKKIEAQYNVSSNHNTLHLTLFKDSTFNEKLSIDNNKFVSTGIWWHIDTLKHIFEIEIQKSDIDSLNLPLNRKYQVSYSGIILLQDSINKNIAPNNFMIDSDYTIIEYEKTIIHIPNKENISNACEGWSLNEQQIKNTISHSKLINDSSFISEFTALPCMMNVIIEQDNHQYEVKVNAGGWISVSCNDSTIYYGSFKQENNGLFLMNNNDTIIGNEN